MDRETFAKTIKEKYPQYRDIDNNELVDKIITKYPVYKSQIKDSFRDRASRNIQERGENISQAISGTDEFEGKSAVSRGIGATAEAFGGISSTAYEALPEGTRNLFDKIGGGIGKGFNFVTDKISNNQFLQDAVGQQVTQPDGTVKFVANDLGKLEESLKVASDLGLISGEIFGASETAVVGNIAQKATVGGIKRGAKLTGEGIVKVKNTAKGAKQIVDDVIPTSERLTEFQVTRALDLTQGDVKNISRSTGNEVGDFIAQKNLIGDTKDATLKNVDDFFDTNFKQVRAEIAKVDKTYKISEVPRAKQALDALKKQVDGVAGLEDVSKEVGSLLKKKNLSLGDVQRVKELLDDQFSLFKVTGDVKDSVTKEGLANVRNEIKSFLEKEVKDTTDIDIADLNNNVATSKSISNAITDRSTRGLTRSTLKLGDLGIFGLGTALGTPLFGVALVVAKKVLESAPIRLRMAKYLDGVSDAKKAKIIKELEEGKVPKEIEDIVGKESFSKGETPTKLKGSLTEEAKKFKSADEFVEAQPKVFHGTTAEFENFDFKLTGKASDEGILHNLRGSWFVDNKVVAEGFSRKDFTGGAGNVMERVVDTKGFHVIDAKGKTLNDFRDEMWDAKKLVKDENKRGLVIKNLVDNKDFSKSDAGNHIFVVDDSAIKTKSQLKEIWEKANNL